MSKKSILSLIVILSTIWITFAALNVRANSPSSMSLNYNSTTDVLNATITHDIGSDSPNSHYIEFVRVKIDGSEALNIPYTNQPSSVTFTYSYNITASDGATIEVYAKCKIVGSITRTLTVGDGNGSNGGDDDIVIPGYIGIFLILSASIIVLLFSIRKIIKKV